MAAVTLCSDFGAQENKSVAVSIFSSSLCHEVMGLDAMILVFECGVSSQLFHLLFHFHQEALLYSSLLSAIRVVSSAYMRLLILLY